MRRGAGVAAALLTAMGAAGQTPLAPVARFPIAHDPLTIVRPARAGQPFTVAGPRGAVFGEQQGSFEAWLFPVKILSRFSITAELADYPVPIDLAEHAAAIEVAPAMTTITYSHAAFTVKQRMFATREDPAGVVVLFEIASVRPLRLTFRFRPDMQRMWPAPSHGIPSAEWVRRGASGYYVLHTDDPSFNAVVAMPRATAGVLAPYQERPRTYPVEFKLAFNPKTDAGLFFPLLMTLGDARDLAGMARRVPALYAATESYYTHFFDRRVTAETPDAAFDRALRWAEIAIDQCRVKFHDETGLVAGFAPSADSARPGFGWFFGRDTLWTTYALHSSGDFATSREALEFLIRRQRPDGKIMHEFSQTADLVDWKATPYFYAAADSTPLFVMAMEDYVRTSGDVEFLRKHWDAVKRAYQFSRAHDSDGDGIYENTEGTGWVESWPPGMPHQEIYLAALDRQSAGSLARLAALMHDDPLAGAAKHQAERIGVAIEREYRGEDFYAFSRNADGNLDRTATIYPSVAWWDGRYRLEQAGPMLDRWASAEFSTDWGTRDVSERAPVYDPISYHQGSVWPLFTGWVSLAEYRAGRAASGYAHLMQNADLTWAEDLGAVTELLSGEFFQPLGRSSVHQMWSSAMVLTPVLRGLFGLDWDALQHTLRVAPQLPPDWDRARLDNVPVGDARVSVEYQRQGGELLVRTRSTAPVTVCAGEQCGAELRLALPPVEVGVPHGLPLPGAQTAQPKIVGERAEARELRVMVEGPAGSVQELPFRLNRTGVRVSGAEAAGNQLRVRLPAGEGLVRQTVTFTW